MNSAPADLPYVPPFRNKVLTPACPPPPPAPHESIEYRKRAFEKLQLAADADVRACEEADLAAAIAASLQDDRTVKARKK